MSHSIAHRIIAAVALAALLGVAGGQALAAAPPYPALRAVSADAAGAGIFAQAWSWLASFWPGSPGDRSAAVHPIPPGKRRAAISGDGAGIDPNGGSKPPGAPPPPPTGSGG
ncbi:MAG TPA: hypothetical protein VOA87_02535 [Thermoanaerobaculia bacterium]|nr:hypothetical protein [Thermoanaerobaculia bacterium]